MKNKIIKNTCHTERSEVSHNLNRDISLHATRFAQNDNEPSLRASETSAAIHRKQCLSIRGLPRKASLARNDR